MFTFLSIASYFKMDVEKASLKELQDRVKYLEAQLASSSQQSQNVVRPKIAQMSSEVVDSNPYSRLMALKRMGIVDNYEVTNTYSL